MSSYMQKPEQVETVKMMILDYMVAHTAIYWTT